MKRPRHLAVRAIGLACPLGGLVSGAAGFRAGMAHPSSAPDQLTMAAGDDSPSPVPVHALPDSTFGFEGIGRLVALLVDAFEDLCTTVEPSVLEGILGVFVAIPDPYERPPSFPQEADDLPDEADARATTMAIDLLRRTDEVLGLGLAGKPSVQGFFGGQCAFAKACAAASAQVGEGRIPGALVVAVDSLADPALLESLCESGRLKSGDSPTGFSAGEAAVIAYLSAIGGPDPARQVVISSIVLQSDPWRHGDPGAPDGAALSAAAREAMATTPVQGTTTLMSDADGEFWRAHELGAVLVRLRALDPRFIRPAILFPAVSFGNVGAAFGGLSLALAVRAGQRGYAAGPSSWIFCSDDGGDRAVISVSLVVS